jgi:hypothetical protein
VTRNVSGEPKEKKLFRALEARFESQIEAQKADQSTNNRNKVEEIFSC